MSEKDDGGNAFPWVETGEFGQTRFANPGMTLRDYFASDALKAIIIHADNDARASMLNTSSGFPIDRMEFAKTAYQYADAMLLARDL